VHQVQDKPVVLIGHQCVHADGEAVGATCGIVPDRL
jgi:hypothetical protein